METVYYIYRHVRHDKNEPFYIGIGKKRIKGIIDSSVYHRAYSKSQRNRYWKFIVKNTTYSIEILIEHPDRKFIEQKEIEFILLYGRGMDGGVLCNMTTGGEGAHGLKGIPKPAYFSEILSKRSVGNKYGLGKTCSEETKSKIAKANKERFSKMSIEEKSAYAIRMGNIKRGVKQKPCKYTDKWYNKKESEKIKVSKYTLDNTFIEEFNSLTEAANSGKFLMSKISNCCNNKRKSHGKFIWKFSEEANKKE